MTPKEALEVLSDTAGFGIHNAPAAREDVAFVEEAEAVLAAFIQAGDDALSAFKRFDEKVSLHDSEWPEVEYNELWEAVKAVSGYRIVATEKVSP